MTLTEVLPQVYWIAFPDSQSAARCFMRFQEHYESPEFRNKIFSHSKYRKWYAKTNEKKTCTYHNDWNGFNIPSYALLPFYSGAFNPLTRAEQDLLALLMYKTGKYYVIASAESDKETLKHEMMHGLYYTNRQYQVEVDKKLQKSALLPMLEKVFRKLGYHPDVYIDEANAYLVTCKETLAKEGFPIEKLSDFCQQLDDLFQYYKTTGEAELCSGKSTT